jgi:hypothetical protein
MPVSSIAASPVVLLLWVLARNRTTAFLSFFPYMIVAGRDVPVVIARYTGLDTSIGWAIVLNYSALISALTLLGWHIQLSRRMLGMMVVMVLLTLPPAGSLIYASPLTGAGYWFPGSGSAGLLLTVLAIICAALASEKKSTPAILALIACLVTSILSHSTFDEPNSSRIKAIQTSLGVYPINLDEQWERQFKLLEIARKGLASEAEIVVLPEEVAGVMQPRFEWMWLDMGAEYAKKNKTLLVGKDVMINPSGKRLKNALVGYGKHPQLAIASAPVPIGSWKPWVSQRELHFPANWFGSASIKLDHGHLNIFFCWEELMMWPWLWSSILNPDPIATITVVNHWFAEGLSITDSQQRSASSMAKLYGWQWMRSVNR